MANGMYDRLQKYSRHLYESYPSPPLIHPERQPMHEPLEGGIMTRSRRNTAPTTMQSTPQSLYPGVDVDSHYSYATEPSESQMEASPVLDAQPVSPPGPPPSEEASGGAESEGSHNPSGSRTGKRKRSRVTPAQLAQLERAFAKDRSPTAARRKEISEMLGMQERQTQVWFQNRRAKAKLLEQRARSGHLASHSRTEYPGMVSAPPERDGDLHALLHEGEPIFVIPCSDLSIGTFRRISAGVHDLVGYTCENKRCLTWFIYSAGTGFKMEMPYDSISATEYADGPSLGQARAAFLLTRPPTFYRESTVATQTATGSTRTWQLCEDWTEGHQASSCLRHEVVGTAAQLEEALSVLRGESFHSSFSGSTRASTSYGGSNQSSANASPVSSIAPPALLPVGPVPIGTAPPSSYMDPFSRSIHTGHGRKRSRSNPAPYEARRQAFAIRSPVSAGALADAAANILTSSPFARQQDEHRSDYPTFSDLDLLPMGLVGPSNNSSSLNTSLADAPTIPISRSYTSSTASSTGMFPSHSSASSSSVPFSTEPSQNMVSAPVHMGEFAAGPSHHPYATLTGVTVSHASSHSSSLHSRPQSGFGTPVDPATFDVTSAVQGLSVDFDVINSFAQHVNVSDYMPDPHNMMGSDSPSATHSLEGAFQRMYDQQQAEPHSQ